MILAQEFYLKYWQWRTRVFYIIDSIPIQFILDELRAIGAKPRDMEEVENLFDNDVNNKGLTYSNLKRRESIIIIGKTSCAEEFQHTFDHEKLHLAMHIAMEDEIDPFSEALAYLVGDIGQEMFPLAKKFLCEHCRKDII